MRRSFRLMERHWALAACLVACAPSAAAGAEAADEAPRTIVAESALLRVVEQVATPARVAGVLATMQAEEGDVVKEGDVLATIDDAEATLMHQRAVIEHELARQRAGNDVGIRSAQKALDFSWKEYLRLKHAAERLPGSISQSELAESKVAAEQAELDLEQARKDHQLEALTERLKGADRALAKHNLHVRRVLAPINGMVVEILRRRGEWVEPGEDVMRIMRIDRLRAEGLVAVHDVLQGLDGAEARITVSAPGGTDVTATGRIVFVSPEINPVNGQVRVRAEFANPAGRLRPGMRASMVIYPRPAADAEAAPIAAGPARAANRPVSAR